MPVDASIALQARPPMDPTESYGRALQLKSLLNQQAMQDFQMQQAQRGLDQETALNEAYRSQVGEGGQLNREGLFRDLASRGLGSKIPVLQKQFADADKAAVDVKNTQSQIDERTWTTLKKRTDATNAMFSSLLQNPNVTHDDVIMGLTNLVGQGVVSREEGLKAVQSLPSNPNALRGFLMQKGLESMEAGKRLEMLTPKFRSIDAGNRILTGTEDQMTGQFTPTASAVKAPEGFVVGPNGRLSVDPGFLQAKKDIAQAGSTKLQINTAKPLLETMAEGLGKQLDAGLSGAQSAVQTIQNAQNLRRLVDSGKIISGPGADARVVMAQIGSMLGVGGKDDAERLANTRTAMQSMAKAELDAAQSMKGQGAMSDAERALVKRASGGDISMTGAELRALAVALEKGARGRINQHLANVERLKNLKDENGRPIGSQLVPFYSSVEMPPEMAQPTGLPSMADIDAELARRNKAKP